MTFSNLLQFTCLHVTIHSQWGVDQVLGQVKMDMAFIRADQSKIINAVSPNSVKVSR